MANILLAQSECSDLDIRSCRRAYQLGLCDAVAASCFDSSKEPRDKANLGKALEEPEIAFGQGTITGPDSLLRAAAAVGNDRIAQLTIPDPEPVALGIERALVSAAMLGHESTVCLLVEWFKKSKYADSVLFQSALVNSLLQASANGHVAVMNVLFSSWGRPPPSANITILDGLNSAIRGNHDQVVQWALKTCPSLVRHPHLNNSLLAACGYGAFSIVKVLLDRGADPNTISYNGQNCLQQAARSGSLRTVCLLLDRGVECGDAFKADLLSVAAQRGHQDIVQHFISLGCDINEHSYGASSLTAAARNEELSMVRFLIAKGARLEEPSIGGQALEDAAEYGHVDVVKLLVEQGVPVNGTKPENNPMLWALMYDQRDVVRTLLQLGADEADSLKSVIAPLFEEGVFPQKR